MIDGKSTMGGKAIYLTLGELYFLLTQRNLQGLAVFEEIKGYIPEEQEIVQGVLSLTEKGILAISNEGSYHLSETIKTALDILEQAESAFVINGYLLSCPMQCCYFKNGLCLILQMDDFRENSVRIELLDRDDAVTGFLDYEFMPDADIVQCEMSDVSVPDDMDMTAMQMSAMEIEELLSDEAVLLVVERYFRNFTSPVRRAVVFSEQERYYLAVNTGRGLAVELFSQEAFSGLFAEV